MHKNAGYPGCDASAHRHFSHHTDYSTALTQKLKNFLLYTELIEREMTIFWLNTDCKKEFYGDIYSFNTNS